MTMKKLFEQINVAGTELAAQVERLIHEGNVRRIIIKDAHGNTYMEIPVTVATVSVLAAPVLAALGTFAALVTSCSIVVERAEESSKPADASKSEEPAAESEPVTAADNPAV
jgi:hypothetical protein